MLKLLAVRRRGVELMKLSMFHGDEAAACFKRRRFVLSGIRWDDIACPDKANPTFYSMHNPCFALLMQVEPSISCLIGPFVKG